MPARSGLPTHVAPGKAFGNAHKVLSATFANTLLAKPAIEFCSCNTNGLPNKALIMPPGKVTYPPIPNTTSGCTRRKT